MQQSNGYILIFSTAITVVLGGLLALASESLKPQQKRQVQLDTKKQILNAVIDTQGKSKADLEKIYAERIRSIVVDYQGEPIQKDTEGNPVVAENVKIRVQYKKPKEKRLYPVFKYVKQGSEMQVESYIIPMYGKGLWNDIWGYLAIQTDFNTVKGASFDHIGETPGLGARITSSQIQHRYRGKKLYKGSDFLSITMLKGEGNPNLDDYHIDGMSGATITGDGVNDMMKDYVQLYKPFFNKTKKAMLSRTNETVF